MNALNHQSIVFFGHISSSVNNEYHMVTVFDENVYSMRSTLH